MKLFFLQKIEMYCLQKKWNVPAVLDASLGAVKA